jgi:hypothetical protein
MMRGTRGAGCSGGDAATEAEVGASVHATLFGLKSASAASRAFVTCARSSWAFVGCQSCGKGFLRMCSALDFEYGVRPITCRTESRYEDFRVRASLTVTIVHRDCGFLQKQTEGHRHCPGCAECDHHNVGRFRYRSSITPRCRRDGRRGDRHGTPHVGEK